MGNDGTQSERAAANGAAGRPTQTENIKIKMGSHYVRCDIICGSLAKNNINDCVSSAGVAKNPPFITLTHSVYARPGARERIKRTLISCYFSMREWKFQRFAFSSFLFPSMFLVPFVLIVCVSSVCLVRQMANIHSHCICTRLFMYYYYWWKLVALW